MELVTTIRAYGNKFLNSPESLGIDLFYNHVVFPTSVSG